MISQKTSHTRITWVFCCCSVQRSQGCETAANFSS